MDDINNDDPPDPQDQGAGGGDNAAENANDPALDQDQVQGIRDPRVLRAIQDMQNRFDQRLIDEQQAANDRLQHLLQQQANDHRAQNFNLQRQFQDAMQQQQQQQQPANLQGLPPFQNPPPPRGNLRVPPPDLQPRPGLANIKQPGAVPQLPNVPPLRQVNPNVAAGNVQPPAAPLNVAAAPAGAPVGVPGVVPPPAAPAAQMAPGIQAVNPVLPAAMVAPNDWEQNRAFAAAPDPQAATVPGQVGDLGAINLQILRILRMAQINDPQAVADIDNLADYIRPIVAASDATRDRERISTELQPLTVVPANWGNVDRIANIRLYNVPNFSGTSTDTIDIVSWLDRVFSLGTSNQLTERAVVNLMIMTATRTPADYIRQMRDEHKTPHQIVQALELNYGDLCLPEEAMSRCNNLQKKEKEKLADFIDCLRKMAKMAYRNVPAEDRRLELTDSLIKSNIRRALPLSLTKSLDDRMRIHLSMGKPER